MFSITNGFDADDFRPKPEALTPNFTITYTGRLYQGKRNPTPLFEAIHELIQEGVMDREVVRVRFYGSIEPWLPALVQSFGLEDVVEIAGSVSRDEALRRQRESQALLMLCWSDLRETGQHTGKVFEYVGARRPVLAVGGSRGVVSDLLEQTRTGVHARAKDELKDTLRTWYAEYRQNGRILYRGDERKIQAYTHEANGCEVCGCAGERQHWRGIAGLRRSRVVSEVRIAGANGALRFRFLFPNLPGFSEPLCLIACSNRTTR